MEPTNKKDKFAVAVIGHKNSVVVVVVVLVKGKSGRFAKTIFYFLEASNFHGYKVCVTEKTVNQGNDKGMKIPCILIFKGQSEFVDTLSQELKKDK